MRRKPASTSPPSAYWDGVARQTRPEAPAPLWRLAADATNRALLERWLPAGRLRRVLKTDLFDELAARGLAPLLAARSDAFVGIDISREAAAHARRRGGDPNVAIADVRRLPFASGSFTAVVSHSTLDHFATRDEIAVALREIRRVLQPGGTLVVTLDNLRQPVIAARNALAPMWQRLGLLPYAMGASLGPRALARVLEASGFEVVELTAVHHFPRLALVALDRLRRGEAAAQREHRAARLGNAGEALAAWPTRYLTGQYVAALARAPGSLAGTATAPPAARARRAIERRARAAAARRRLRV